MASRLDDKTLSERQLILQLALQESFRKRDECKGDFNELNKKLNSMMVDGYSFTEKDKVVESMIYLKECRNGWQETIDRIREWQDELKS
ncbi:hypothetical protein D3C84_703990 [compost metagenome]